MYVPDVTPREVIDQTALALRKKLPTPSLALSPSSAAGGIVNLGMWLAVQDAGEVSVTAQLGPIWATVRARQRDLTWDMGNGDVVSCTGVGTPIVDASTHRRLIRGRAAMSTAGRRRGCRAVCTRLRRRRCGRCRTRRRLVRGCWVMYRCRTRSVTGSVSCKRLE